MAMSWVAEAQAMASDSASTTQGASGTCPTPARHRVRAKSAICISAAQPRRRPSHGSDQRSMSGAQSTLKVHGAWVSVTRPTILRSTPLDRSQSGIAIQTSPSGIPDENASSDTAAVRGERSAWAIVRNAPGFFGGVPAGGGAAPAGGVAAPDAEFREAAGALIGGY